ncbi:MAG: efflux transporter outer membrane subunit [Proteobacteria bacterium]|nr:efflux transporter outer membrane subunit [Pseudomonadota bacterium]
MRGLLLLAGVLLLGACAVGPNYTRPDLKIPDRFRFAPDASSGTSLGDMQWWDLYQDAHLQELIRAALRENLDVRVAAARVEEARAALGSAHLALLPQISVQAGAQRGRTAQDLLRPGQLPLGNEFQAQGVLSYELDIWGRLRRSSEAARADFLSSEYAKRAVLVGLISDVATAYFDLISLHQELDITRRTVQTRQKLVELTRAKHDRGVISGLDVAAVEAQLAVARVSIPQQELALAQAEHRLAILLGRYPQGFELPASTEAPRAAPMPPAGLPSSLIERRPDIMQSEQSLVAANARVGVAKAALLPTLSLTGAFGRISTELSRLFTSPNEAWLASAGLLQPLLDPQRSLYTQRAAQARWSEALAGYQQTVQRAFAEVADALIARSKQVEIEVAQRDQVEALRRASTIAHARYEAGTASYVDVTNADRDLFTAELSLATASRDSLLTTVQLYRALGGGWQEPATPQS